MTDTGTNADTAAGMDADTVASRFQRLKLSQRWKILYLIRARPAHADQDG